jgi:hypothetical protein
MLEIAILLLLVLITLSIVYDTLRYGISPMPSSRKAKRALLDALPDSVTGTIYELGSGWGTLAFPLAKKYPQAKVIGYEKGLIPYLFSKGRQLFTRQENLVIYWKNFFDIPLNDASLVVCYLYPEAMRKLKIKFEKELKPKTWVASNTFAIPGWKAKKEIAIHDFFRGKLYIYLKT